jgi:putative hydrolase of the HAD superfamily
MQKQNIIFNLDDTLIQCNQYFNQVINQFAEQMTEWFESLTKEEIKQKQLEIDIESVEKNGLTTEHFPQSFVDTYLHYCELTGKRKEDDDIELLRKLGRSVFEIAVEPLPNMYKTLKQLKEEGHELYLHTGGEEANQRRKISQLELAVYFEHRVFISKHKDTTALTDILKTMDFDREKTWMIGNSLRTDILPALELGINTIYIPAKAEWEYNKIEVNVEPKGAFLTLTSLNEVPEAMNNYINQEEYNNIHSLSANYDFHNQQEEGNNIYT